MLDLRRFVRPELLLPAALVIMLTAGAVVTYLLRSTLPWIDEDLEALRAWVLGLGAAGPAVVLVLSVLQIVIAPIPNSVVGYVAAYVYGFWGGLALTIIGGLLGASTALLLARKLGRPIVGRFANGAALAAIDRVGAARSPLVWIAVFLPPLGDALYYAAGFTAAPVRSILIGVLIGRLPQWIMLNLFGAAAEQYGAAAWIAGLAFGAALSLAYAIQQTWARSARRANSAR
ncbi:MAG: VTT domain-containing protein [Chloroflexota bacterium]|nr:VTT domain-containing protein [Dehalococcoidia bacterium]MDW8255200.1 VTT domain-containing protein [Chloroflexota bacterium]